VQDTNLYCKKCPAEHCQEQNSSSKCSPCAGDEYIEYPNDFSKCIGCKTCRADQVQVSPCQPTRNTQCACKNGTFCSPDHPCEMCQKCRPRCSKDEVELAPCTPQSDRQCGPPTDTFSSFSNLMLMLSKTDSFPLPCFCGVLSSQSQETMGVYEDLLPQQSPESGRGFSNPISGAWRQRLCQGLVGAMGYLYFQVSVPGTSYHSGKPRKNLVPVQGKNSIHLLRRSFDIFAQEVPYKDWKRFGRALDLLENDIVLAEMNDKYSLEPFFQMLNTWQNRQGMNASVNTLLETLHRINLGGIAEDISSKLVQQGYFEYEVN
ncbi:Tumor necrosis factor receptor superfamily member 10B, partial [Cuculus canorus]